MILGQLAKLKIIAYKGPSQNELAFDDRDLVGQGSFLVQVNPENYTIAYSVAHKKEEQPAATSGYNPPWDKNLPKNMSFEFLFDGTGAIPSIRSDLSADNPLVREISDPKETSSTVFTQIQLFERTVFNVRGDIREPNYLVINWGKLVFKCRLTAMNITYKMFSPEGFPLRAVANVTFMEVIADKDEVKQAASESPDITHVQKVREGDTLPVMAKRIYGDERYYIAVAQANKLIQFRNLTPGQEIYFPPIQRT